MFIDCCNQVELVPVDLCVNSLLQSAYDVALHSYEKLPVYNFVTDRNNLITLRKYTDLFMTHSADYPQSKCIWYPTFLMIRNEYLMLIVRFFYHTLPAIVMDLGLTLCGRKPM
jgi:alcohol-forming fatty acyl-CoA reductase